jgi:hypothetical protein
MLNICLGIGQLGLAGPPPCASDNGDTNGDNSRDISDAVYTLTFLFQGGSGAVLFCNPAGDDANCATQNGDVNGDNALDISDSVFSLAFLFQGGEPPASICLPNVECLSYADVQPLLAAKCSPCHVGDAPGSCFSGGTCFVSFYEDTQGASGVCAGKTIYECMLIRMLNGTMPRTAPAPSCSGNSANDEGNAACLDASDFDMIEAWVGAGAPETATDTDGDGICDSDDGCTDFDGDGVGNGNMADTDCATATVDSDDADPFVCADDNMDSIDDCTYGKFSIVEASGTYADVQPIFQAKCSPCHVGEVAGSCLQPGTGTCFASFYEDTQGPAGFACSGRTLYECIIIRIKDGTMPRGRGCSGNPTQDAGNDSCLDASEIEAVEAWALNGGPETP